MHGTLSPLALPRYSSILAFDLGKFNSVLCRFDPATAAHSFVALTTDREAITRELDPVPIADRAATLVVFETCDISGWVYDHISAMGFAIAIANPATEAWRWTKIKRKTDRDDALKLAKLASMNQLDVELLVMAMIDQQIKQSAPRGQRQRERRGRTLHKVC